MMKTLLALLLLTARSVSADLKNMEMSPAIWHHGLNSTTLTDYQRGEHLVISEMWTGNRGTDAVVRHSLQVKVTAWNKPHTKSWESDDKRKKETLTVTLHKTTSPREMRAEFDHTVFEDGKVVLRFSGITLLLRLDE